MPGYCRYWVEKFGDVFIGGNGGLRGAGKWEMTNRGGQAVGHAIPLSGFRPFSPWEYLATRPARWRYPSVYQDCVAPVLGVLRPFWLNMIFLNVVGIDFIVNNIRCSNVVVGCKLFMVSWHLDVEKCWIYKCVQLNLI